MEKKKLQIHSENILPIIKKWLYSDRDIFVRELVSNACDAIAKGHVLKDKGMALSDEEGRIDIKIDKSAKTLTFEDNGIGMDAQEVEEYIAQIAFSGAEDFVKKYQTDQKGDQFIGHFGLGFYSSYMVADKVEIDTLSYKADAKPAFWSCDGSSEYELKEGARSTRGATITLFINQESEDFLEESKLKSVLKHYCSFLPSAIFLNGEKINTHEPLWMRPPSECKESDYKEFYKHLYPFEEEPLFWMHLNVDYPFHLKGILYFPRIKKDFDFAKNTVKLFCNRVFVSDNCKDVIPEYLMVLRGVIDSPDIPLNVSRSYLQVDKTVRQLSSHISKKVSDSLSALYKGDKERYENSWPDIAPIVKLGVIQDEKFHERVKDMLIWKTLDGAWISLAEYREKNESKTHHKVLYAFEEKKGSHLHDLYRQKGIDVLIADFRLDPVLFQTLEAKNHETSFKRIDAEMAEHLLDKSKENIVLDAEGKTEAGRIADFYRKACDDPLWEIEAQSLASKELPALVVMDEHERRFRDYMQSVDPERLHGMPQKRKLVLNTNNALIEQVAKVQDPELAKELAQEVIELALLSQREMEPKHLQAFIQRTSRILEKLTAGK
jgi:molecular chaperone HtpG